MCKAKEVSTTKDVEVGVKPAVTTERGSRGSFHEGQTTSRLPVTFKDLTYSVKLKSGPQVILNGLTGCFEPGKLTALFGPSGCGKTSLMDVLAGRKTTGTIAGEIRFGGANCRKENLMHICGYVEQFDNLVEVLTVELMLMYTADLKLPALVSSTIKLVR